MGKEGKERSLVQSPTYGIGLWFDGRGPAGRWQLVFLSRFMPHCELGNKHLTILGALLPFLSLPNRWRMQGKMRRGQEVSTKPYCLQALPTAQCTRDPGQNHLSLDPVIPQL